MYNVLLTGAFLFCPPEVFSKPKYYAVPTNVWALGVTLFMMVNTKLPFCNVKQILDACPYTWKADVSSGEETDTDKHLPLILAFIRYLRRCFHMSALVCYVVLTNRLSPPNFCSMQ